VHLTKTGASWAFVLRPLGRLLPRKSDRYQCPDYLDVMPIIKPYFRDPVRIWNLSPRKGDGGVGMLGCRTPTRARRFGPQICSQDSQSRTTIHSKQKHRDAHKAKRATSTRLHGAFCLVDALQPCRLDEQELTIPLPACSYPHDIPLRRQRLINFDVSSTERVQYQCKRRPRWVAEWQDEVRHQKPCLHLAAYTLQLVAELS
jgi:hypothetical protein